MSPLFNFKNVSDSAKRMKKKKSDISYLKGIQNFPLMRILVLADTNLRH